MINYNESQLSIINSPAKYVSWLFDISSTGVSVSALATEAGETLETETETTILLEDAGSTAEADASTSYYRSTKTLNSLLRSGSVTRANTRLSLADGAAFAWLNGVDLSPYIGCYLVVRDSTGKRAGGWIKAAGTEETCGSELVQNGGFETDPTVEWTEGSDAVLASVAGGVSGNCLRITADGTNTPYAYQYVTGIDAGALFLFSYYIKAGTEATAIAYVWLGTNPVPPMSEYAFEATGDWVHHSFYGTLEGGITAILGHYGLAGSGTTIFYDTASIKQVTAPHPTGVTIVSSQGGGTYNWTEIDLGFNYNDAAGYSYAIHLNESGDDYTYGIVNFSGITLRASHPEIGLQLQNETGFSILDPDDTIPEDDLVGGTAIISLRIATPIASTIAGRWKFRITRADRTYGKIQIEAESYFWHYFSGFYPNTKLVGQLWNMNDNSADDSACVPQPFGTAYIPLKSVTDGSSRAYLLGPTTVGGNSVTYAITKIRTPRRVGKKWMWLYPNYTFTQAAWTDPDSCAWRVFYPVIGDSDKDGVPEKAGFWKDGDTYLSLPTQFSRSDTASITNPAEVIEYVLEDMGIASDDIDDDSFTTAAAVYSAWDLEFNGAYWHKKPRTDVIAQLLTMCNSYLLFEEKVRLVARNTSSQKEITKSNVIGSDAAGGGSFAYRMSANSDIIDDCGYIAWQQSGESQDAYIKSLVPADNEYNHISGDVLEIPFIQDSDNAKRAGSLHFFRKLNKKADVSFSGILALVGLRPDDVITVAHSDYGGSYDAIIDQMRITHGGQLQFNCIRYRGSLRSWEQVVFPAVTITEDPEYEGIWRPVMMGPDAVGGTPNLIIGRLRVGDSAVIDGDLGGFYVSSTVFGGLGIQLEYNSGSPRFYCGDGLNEFMQYTEGGGLAISTATAEGITVKSGGSLVLESGGDVVLRSLSGGNTAYAQFVGTNRTYFLGTDYDNDRLVLMSDTINLGDFYIGVNADSTECPLRSFRVATENFMLFTVQDSAASRYSQFMMNDVSSYLQSCYDSDNKARFALTGGLSASTAYILFSLVYAGVEKMIYLSYSSTDSAYYLGPGTNKGWNLGASNLAWDTMYADDWTNVADFAYMDDIDDLAIIRAIRKHPSAVHKKTGLPIIDDATLDPVLINKRAGVEERDPDGRPWVSSSTIFGLIFGAIKQLDAKLTKLEI